MSKFSFIFLFVSFCSISIELSAQLPETSYSKLEKKFKHPPESAKPWVFWYWMHAAVSKKGITADLESMKAIGIGGAYLMPIKDTSSAIHYDTLSRQLSPEWYALVRFAVTEAKRLGLKLGIHVSDGFALAGGPWIKPEQSMQKIVWSKTVFNNTPNKIVTISGTKTNNSSSNSTTLFSGTLPMPEVNESYYRDIAVYAYPNKTSVEHIGIPKISSSKSGLNVDFLKNPLSKETFRSDSLAWILFAYETPITCRSLVIHTTGNNYQSQRLLLETSDNGIDFKLVKKLESPRHGWQDTDEPITHSIPPTTAKYFRFIFDKTGTLPGSEDLDAAKWKPTLKLNSIELSSEALINQFESKNGSIWRVSKRSIETEIPDSICLPLQNLIDVSAYFKNGQLNWQAPAGDWTIIRIGHTSTGHKNETAGAGKGLECDKFNAAAIKLQFANWFGKIYEQAGPTAKEVINMFHIDSWECGSQNWSANFEKEFKKRRGYSLMPWLPVMAGIPIQSAEKTEQVLHDIRETIAELVNDIFYQTMATLAKEKNCDFSAESIAPTMMSDGMLHYSKATIPMGEFWLRSPTHDKPNDMLDAISGGHIYGKKIIQSESFTELRMAWDEYPGMLKAIGDRNLALGVNRLVFHVYTHNPWIEKKPGMTLDGVGLYFQRDQTWFKQSKAWLDYIARSQSLLQAGNPVVDIAVFTGEELPRRALLPDRLVTSLPGIFGKERVVQEQKRLLNAGQPQRTIPDGVTHSLNMADPEKWINPLNGYAYDSFNPDVLLNLASVKNGRVVLPGGASYALMVFPSQHQLMPDNQMSVAVANKILQLLKEGATILMDVNAIKNDSAKNILLPIIHHNKYSMLQKSEPMGHWSYGKGKLVLIPYEFSNFQSLRIDPDVLLDENANNIAFNHRKTADADIYFISNQDNYAKKIDISLRTTGKTIEHWNPVTGETYRIKEWELKNGRTNLGLFLDANESAFIIITNQEKDKDDWKHSFTSSSIHWKENDWKLQFDPAFGGPKNEQVYHDLLNWTNSGNDSIKYYSGSVIYRRNFEMDKKDVSKQLWLNIGEVHDIASVRLNGFDCGTIFTAPNRIDISMAVLSGVNQLEITVTNTWANKLIGDHLLPESKRLTFITAPFRLESKPLLKAGLIGPVSLEW